MTRSVLFFACAFYGGAVVWACSSSSSPANPYLGWALPVPASATGLPDACTDGAFICSVDSGVTLPPGLCEAGMLWLVCDGNEYRWYTCFASNCGLCIPPGYMIPADCGDGGDAASAASDGGPGEAGDGAPDTMAGDDEH